MENINIKSLIIGALLTSTIFLGVAATSPTDKWDEKQIWEVRHILPKGAGWEPFSVRDDMKVLWRRRTK